MASSKTPASKTEAKNDTRRKAAPKQTVLPATIQGIRRYLGSGPCRTTL